MARTYVELLARIKGETPALKHVIATNVADFFPAHTRVLGKLLNPKRIEFVEAMPLTSVGKVDKKALERGAAE